MSFRALIGELFPIISFPTFFSLSGSSKLLGTYIAPIGDGASIWAKAREVSGSGLYFNYPTRNDPAVLLRSNPSCEVLGRGCPDAATEATRQIAFGGVGNSGMGKYHGDWGFRSYTNARGVLNHSTWLDLGFRYPPYNRYRMLREIAVPS